MSDKVDLRVDWCSYEAAKYAVMNWHYSRRMPKFKQIYIGAWEGSDYIGAVIFGLSVTPYLGDRFGLLSTQCAELTRIALRAHASPVSQITTRAIQLVNAQSPGLRLLVSYADPLQGHNGAVYQAMNWVYVGDSAKVRQYYWRGQWRNDTSMFRAFRNDPQLRQACEHRDLPAKHKYLYPLDRAMRRQIAPLAQPYPKRETCGQSIEGDTSGDQPERAGSTPAARSSLPDAGHPAGG